MTTFSYGRERICSPCKPPCPQTRNALALTVHFPIPRIHGRVPAPSPRIASHCIAPSHHVFVYPRLTSPYPAPPPPLSLPLLLISPSQDAGAGVSHPHSPKREAAHPTRTRPRTRRDRSSSPLPRPMRVKRRRDSSASPPRSFAPRSPSPPTAQTPKRQPSGQGFQGGAGERKARSACTLCLGRHSHDTKRCSAPSR